MFLAEITGGTTPDHLRTHGQIRLADTQAEHDLMGQHAQSFRRIVIASDHRADIGAALA